MAPAPATFCRSCRDFRGRAFQASGRISVDDAFTVLRSYGRVRNRRLSGLACAFIDGSEDLSTAEPGAPLPGG